MNPRPLSRPTTSVSHEVALRLLDHDATTVPVRAILRYEAADPYAVRIGFHTAATTVVEWTFARELLDAGVRRAAGAGDVRVWPTRSAPGSSGAGRVCVSLNSPSGTALFDAPCAELVVFLERAYEVVPAGAESGQLDLDAELALLLWDGVEG